jgi:hypothetical protein
MTIDAHGCFREIALILRVISQASHFIFQSFIGNVRVNLRCRALRVPHRLLSKSKVACFGVEVGPECVPERMRMNILVDPCFLNGIKFNHPPDIALGQSLA